MFKKILTIGLFIVFLLPCVFANSKISLGDKALLISKTAENNNVYNEGEVVYDEDYEAYEDEEYEEEAEDTEYYDKNGKKVIFANSPSAKGRQSKSSNSRQQINIVSSNMNSNLALSPYNLTYYNEHKKTTLGAFGCSFLNFLLGLGIGSFFQGDDSAGGKFLATDLIALAIGGSCVAWALGAAAAAGYGYSPSTEFIIPVVIGGLCGVTFFGKQNMSNNKTLSFQGGIQQ